MRTRWTVVAAALVLGLVASPSGVATAAPPHDTGGTARAATPLTAPPGWEIKPGPAGPTLVWRAPDPVPIGDAAVEFYAGDRLLGRPRPDRRQQRFELAAADLTPDDLGRLAVRAAGRRLDAAGVAARTAPRSDAPAPTVPATPAATSKVDPGTPGSYSTLTGEYELTPVRLPEFSEPVEMRGVVVAPRGAPGRRPLALFLHGRHSTCYDGPGEEDATGDWPCPPGYRPIPSHAGYLQAQRLLASQGYVTVSISANGINGQDYQVADGGAQARSSLVRLHLARWADWAGAARADAPRVVRDAPPADLSKVLLIGHSRGGEGVNRAAMDSLTPPPAAQDGYRGPVRWKIRGTVLIGPTIFGHNPTPDVPSLTILPGCDGDVSDLQGEIYVDGTRGVSRGAALHSAVYVIGANHNFFNTEWTPGQAQAPAWDDFWSEEPDPVCSPGTATRLTPQHQQTAGTTYIAAAARLFVRGDDRVRPLLDGGDVRAPSAGPARVLGHAVGAARTPLLVPDASVRVTGPDGRLCAQVSGDPDASCAGRGTDVRSPHFVPFGWMERDPDRYAVALRWSAPGRPVRLRPARPASIAGAESLALRLVVPPNRTGTRLDVAVRDADGRRVVLGQARLTGLPGTEFTTSHWAQEVRLPLAAAQRAGVDLRRVAALELVPRSRSGRAWLIDAWGWRPGTPAPRPVALPRVDIGELTVDEGDSGVRTYRMPIKVTGRGNAQVRLFLVDPVTNEITSRLATIGPGTGRIDIKVRVRGNERYGYDAYHAVFARTVHGAVIGDYDGGVIVNEDDPAPEITVTPVADRVTEGAALTWRMTLSTDADALIWAFFPILPPASGVELSSADVDPEWFESLTGEPALPARPLSETYLSPLWAGVDPGGLTTELSIPTIADEEAEPAEHVRIQMFTQDPDSEETIPGPEFTGTVVDS